MGRTLLFVGRIPHSARHRDIAHFFRGYGRINEISLIGGHAFIEFDRNRDAEDAVRELDGHRMMGDKVIVDFAMESNDSRQRSNKDKAERRNRRYRSGSSARSHNKYDRRRRSRSPVKDKKEIKLDKKNPLAIRRSKSRNEDKENRSGRSRSSRDSRRGRSSSKEHRKTNRDSVPDYPPAIKKERIYDDGEVGNEKMNARSTSSQSGSLFQFNFIDSPPRSPHHCDCDERLSLPGLPTDILKRIFDSSEHSRTENLLELRLLNKKMDQRILGMLSFNTLNLTIFGRHYFLNLKNAQRSWQTKYPKDDLWAVCELVEGLNRWSNSVSIARIEINIHADVDEHIGAAIKALLQFNTDQLKVVTEIVDPDEYPFFNYSTAKYRPDTNLPQLDFSTLLVMSANIKEVSIMQHVCTEIDAVDLSILWKTLAEGECKLESFTALFDLQVAQDFIQACFHVNVLRDLSAGTIEYQYPPHAQFPIQLYSSNSSLPETLINFDGDLQTEVHRNIISFKKIGAEEKAYLLNSLHKIKLNHVYHK